MSGSLETLALEVIDIQTFSRGPVEPRSETTDVAHRLVSQLSAIGFARIIGHGVNQCDIDDVFSVSSEFFAQPLDRKMRAVSKDAARRGYSPYGTENFSSLLGNNKPNDLVEKFRMGPISKDGDLGSSDPYYTSKEGRVHFYPNTWECTPDQMQGFLCNYYRQMEALTLTILQILEIGLGLPYDTFQSKMGRHTSILGVNYFKELDLSSGATSLRIAEHTDVSMLTIIAHEEGGVGLDICTRDGIWRSIPPVRGALTVNIGDCLQYWTNHALTSTIHRVSAMRCTKQHQDCSSPTEEAYSTICPTRISVAYFATPDHDALLQLVGDRPADYMNDTSQSNVLYSEWRCMRIRTAMKALKR